MIKISLDEPGVFILDGAMGTELERRGFDTSLSGWTAWALVREPELVLRIHEDYVDAGADIITTNTFRTNPYSHKTTGLDPKELTKTACELAKIAIGGKYNKYIAGSVAPVCDCFSPEMFPGMKAAQNDHYEHCLNLKEGGVDFILAETMNSIKEAEIVLNQTKELNLQAMVSFTLNKDGNILNGDSLIDAYYRVVEFKPTAFLINCTPIRIIEKVIEGLLSISRIPIGIYPNFGEPIDRQFSEYLTPEEFAEILSSFKEKGIKILGGCCGTTPEHIRALKNILTTERYR